MKQVAVSITGGLHNKGVEGFRKTEITGEASP
jgi:hypothetical protein